MKPVPAGNFERDEPYFPGPGRHGQCTLDPSHLQHVDSARAERYRPAYRYGMNEPAVEIVEAVDLDGRQQPGYRAGCHDGRDEGAAGKPARRRVLDASRDTVERQLQVRETCGLECVFEELAQRLDRMQVGP